MRNKLDIIRYGSSCFTYLTPILMFTDISSDISADIASLISFITVSFFIIFIILYLSGLQSMYISDSNYIKILQIAGLFAASIYEITEIHAVFKHSSDFSSTNTGLYVLALIIILIAAICSIAGAYTAIKVSNIIFLIPMVVFILVLISVAVGGITPLSFDTCDTDILPSIFRGIIAALILFVDIYIIIFMQKKEKCYSGKEIKITLTVSLALATAVSIMIRWMFGKVLFQRIEIPFISAIGVIPGFSFDEIMMFAVSVGILYRFICKMCFCTILMKDIYGSGAAVIRILLFGIFSCAVTVGTALYISGINKNIVSFVSLIPNLFAFIVFPLFQSGRLKRS